MRLAGNGNIRNGSPPAGGPADEGQTRSIYAASPTWTRYAFLWRKPGGRVRFSFWPAPGRPSRMICGQLHQAWPPTRQILFPIGRTPGSCQAIDRVCVAAVRKDADSSSVSEKPMMNRQPRCDYPLWRFGASLDYNSPSSVCLWPPRLLLPHPKTGPPR